MTVPIPPLSPSVIKLFRNCPYRWYREKIVRDVRPDFDHPTATWGKRVHEALEKYLDSSEPLPPELEQFRTYAENLDSITGDRYVEHKLAIDSNAEPIDFYSHDALIRSVLDFMVVRNNTAFLIDHKAGKVRPDDQLHINALVIFYNFPQVNLINAAFFWLQSDNYTKHFFERKKLDELWDLFYNHYNQIRLAAVNDHWPVQPSGLCAWCPVADCEHYRR